MTPIFRLLAQMVLFVMLCAPALAEDFRGIAKVDMTRSSIQDRWRGMEVVLALSQPVPYRVFTLDAPRRLVLDFREVDWTDLPTAPFEASNAVEQVNFGRFQPGWSRMILTLTRPVALRNAEMRVSAENGRADVILRLDPVDEATFAAQSGAPASDLWRFDQQRAQTTPLLRQAGNRALRVVIDPGHGGVDPGAERAGVREADLMLLMAKELEMVLSKTPGIDVILTRDEDIFVPLETRLTIARSFRADLFFSIHADALVKDEAKGATIYTLSKNSSDTATAKLADRHNRTDLIAGLDLTGQSDEIMDVLMDLARTDTAPRSDTMAQTLLQNLQAQGVRVNNRPIRSGGFWVLRAPDIPSVLLEVGFLSNSDDLAELLNAERRQAVIIAIRDAIQQWAVTDADAGNLLRK